MWQLIPYYYSENYAVYWLAKWFHSWPHITYDGFKVYDSTFDPEDKTYIETLIFWAGLPVVCLILALGVLFIYCCCQCCNRRRNNFRTGIHAQIKKTKIFQWLLIIFALLCTGVIGVGFYGNEGMASGLQHFVNSADQANNTIDTTEKEVSTLNRDLSSNLTKEITDLRVVFNENIDNRTVKQDLDQLTKRMSSFIEMAVLSLDVGYFAGEVEKYEYFRWVGVIVVLCLQLIICLLALCGAGRTSKPILAGVSVLSTFIIIVVWMMVGGEIFVIMGASDFCVDPNQFLIKEAQRNSRLSEDVLKYYINCNATSMSPFKKSLQLASKDLSLADSVLDDIVRKAKPYYLEEPTVKSQVELVSSTLQECQSDLQEVTASLDCTTIHQDYTTALYSVCYDALTGTSLLLAASVAAGFLLFISIFFAANLVKNIVKRKIDYEVDQEDPFLPPNNPTLERFRRNEDINRPYRRPDTSPGPRLSYQGSVQGYGVTTPGPRLSYHGIVQGYCSDNDARPQGPLGTPAGYTAGARSSFVDDSPLMTSGGFESPPPSYTLAMSRDNQNNSRHQNSRNSRNSGASLV
ncbi:protein tweety homolog 1-B-like [Amphiura filiformis]|uniref:protein tweety homolog 1-B-like n=1 Tax=Amphiura filiformis TaxID=82378 RepID=UPI003B2164FC